MCPDDSNGIYNVPNGTLVNSGDTVLPSQHNPWANDSATAISNRYSKDGRAPLTGNMNVNGFLIRNLGTPTADADAATKQYADNANPNNIYTLVAVNTAVGVSDKGRWYRTATAGIVFTPAPAATLGANHFFRVKNDSTGIVTIDPTGTETINGALTVALNPGSEAYVICDGANFWASIVSQQASGPDYVQGLTLSNNAVDAANDIDIAVGSAKSGSRVVSLSSVMTKRLDASWAAGSGNGGLDAGSKANSTTYHVHSIVNASTGVGDAIFSLSATTPTVPSGWLLVQRLGSVITDSSGNIRSFIQSGQKNTRKYIWSGGSIADVNVTNPGTSAVTRTLTVPTGLSFGAIIGLVGGAAVNAPVASQPGSMLITPLSLPDNTPSITNFTMRVEIQASGDSQNITLGNTVECQTNTSGQVRSRIERSTSQTILRMNTIGFIDELGS